MKILLVNPKRTDRLGVAKFPPIGLGYLATALRKYANQVEIIDCVRDKLSDSSFKELIIRKNHAVVGISCWTIAIKSVINYLKITKQLNNKIITIIGGPHPSAISQDVFQSFANLDFAFKGEAETGLPLLLKNIENGDFSLGNIPGLIWRNGSGDTQVNEPYFIQDLDSLGFPSWDLIKPDTYYQVGTLLPKYSAPLFGTRGCPYHCKFCSVHTIAGRKLRYHSANHLMEEIKFFQKNYHTKRFVIFDENFTFSKDYVFNFCQAILRAGFNLKFILPNGVRLDSLDKEILLLMKRTGFLETGIAVGIESGSDRILKLMKKNLNREQIREKVSLLREVGFKPTGYFILGFPGETEADILETIKFSLELKLYRAAFTPYLPLPGTEAYDEALASSADLKDIDFTTLNTDNVIYAPVGITKKRLNQLRKMALLKFNLRPYILKEYFSDYNSFRFALAKFINIFVRRADVP